MSKFTLEDKERLIEAVADKIRAMEVVSFATKRGVKEIETEDSHREYAPDGTVKITINLEPK